jgi:TfoX/Sxy family transcriptional regulator of competence genes
MLPAVAYDEELAERVRDLLAAVPDVTEQRMFGGLAFMVGGAMAVSVGSGGLLVRRDPAAGDDELPGARPAVMGSRQMRGWLAVDAGAATPDEELAGWVRHGLTAAHHAAHQATGSSSTP